MKKLFFFIVVLFLGCSSKEYIHIPTYDICKYKTNKKIAIEVDLPYYMKDLEIMKLKDYKLISTKKYLSKDFNEILIQKISNKLCDKNVFEYPWKKSDYVVKIKIDDFYFRDKYIILFARVYINSKFKKIFIKKECRDGYKCVNAVFDELSKIIIKEIK